MYQHILIPTDGSDLSKQAIHKAVELAKNLGAKVTFFHAAPDYPSTSHGAGELMEFMPPQQYAQLRDEQVREFLTDAEKTARTAGVSCAVESEVRNAPYRGIVDAAARLHCDLIFMASHGRHGMSGVLLGSETQKVLTHSKLPVLVYR